MPTQFNQQELSRYERHINLPNIGIEGQKLLKNAKVLCVGVGGLGSPLALYLASAGIGTLGLMDDDVVELSNLQRQILYAEKEQGLKKITLAKAKLQALNSDINIILHDTKITEENAEEIIKSYDVVADCSDNFVTRYLVNKVCCKLNKPDVYAGIFQFAGQCSIFGIKDFPCYQCLYPTPPLNNLPVNFARAGLLGVLPGVMGLIQATEILKLILKIGSPLTGKLLSYDLLKMQFQNLSISKNHKCAICAKE